MSTSNLIPDLTPREAILDTLYRLLSGVDLESEALTRSAFSSTATLILPDLAPDQPRPPIVGIDAYLASLERGIGGRLDTEHTIGNARIWIQGPGSRKAKLEAKGVAYHFRKGEGKDPTKRGFHVGTEYKADLQLRDGEQGWMIERLELGIMWAEGDAAVLEVMG